MLEDVAVEFSVEGITPAAWDKGFRPSCCPDETRGCTTLATDCSSDISLVASSTDSPLTAGETGGGGGGGGF